MSTAFLPTSSAEMLTESKLVLAEIEDEVAVDDSTLAIPIVTEAAGTLVLPGLFGSPRLDSYPLLFPRQHDAVE